MRWAPASILLLAAAVAAPASSTWHPELWRPALLAADTDARPPAAPAEPLNIALEWSPTQTVTEQGLKAIDLLPFAGKSIVLEPFTDDRKAARLIGENRERKDEVRMVFTKDDAAVWITQHTRQFLAGLGLPMADAGGDRVITGEVLSFFVAEGGDYIGDVRLKIQVQVGGKVVWSGLAMGDAKHFGRSYKADNYRETLCDSLQAAWISLVGNPAFLAALGQ